MTDTINRDQPEQQREGLLIPHPEASRPVEEEQSEQLPSLENKEQPSASKETAPLKEGLLHRKRRPTVAIPIVRDEVTLKIEKIMEEGLGEAFTRLSPVAQQEFKLKGEETARSLRELLKTTHVKVKKIFRLLLEWLKILPGLNRFFLEQEAKIKADKIIALHKK